MPEGHHGDFGGFKTPSTGVYFNRSLGFGRDWSVEVTNIGATLSDLYDVEAYCVRGKVHRAKSLKLVPPYGAPAPGVVSTATVASGCAKQGRFVRGGGYGLPPPAVDVIRGLAVFRDVLAPKCWSVSVVTIDGTQDAYQAFGYCRPG